VYEGKMLEGWCEELIQAARLSSGRAHGISPLHRADKTAGCACFRLPLMSNVMRQN
jgi:hypothetical protein